MYEYENGGEYREELGLEQARALTEVNHLNRLRLENGQIDPAVAAAVYVNLVPAVKEAAMPYAVSDVYQPLVEGEFRWLDQTTEEIAMSGYRHHWHPSAIDRVHLEVEEAQDINANLQPGRVKIFISPRMTRTDASLEIAKSEHLADDDMLRIHWLDLGENGEVMGKRVQSILLRDVPLEAWRNMLNDPNNLFGKSFNIPNDDSALSIMRVHKELHVDRDTLPEGVVTLIAAVKNYVEPTTALLLEDRLKRFRSNQTELSESAEVYASRWLSFEVELANSLYGGFATSEIEKFTRSLSHYWSERMVNLINSHQLDDGSLTMTTELAAELEMALRNTLWVSAAVGSGNEYVLKQMDEDIAQRIYYNEQLIQILINQGYYDEAQRIAVQNNQLIASANVSVGGGCLDEIMAVFTRNNQDNGSGDKDANKDYGENSKTWKWKDGVCVIKSCASRPNTTKVGPCGVCKDCQGVYDHGGDPNLSNPLRLTNLVKIISIKGLISQKRLVETNK